MSLHLDILKDIFFLYCVDFSCEHFINMFSRGTLALAPNSAGAHTALLYSSERASCVQDMIKVKSQMPFWTFSSWHTEDNASLSYVGW